MSRWRRLALALEAVTFTVLVPGSVTIWIPGGLGLFAVAPCSGELGWTKYVALAFLGVGLLIYLRCVWDFAARGRGIPAPIDHPKALVVSGLYRYVRNPMYFGVLFVLFGEALVFPSWSFVAYIAAVFAVFNIYILAYEEPNLRRRFGDDYARYTSAVSRWVPGKPWRG
jgi:protein-S-isoprenylcysteine O-methyltransferase Ste14